MIGYKPEKLKIFYNSVPKKVKFEWEEAELNTSTQIEQEVFPAFAADASNPKTCETGRQWAENNKPWDHINRQYLPSVDLEKEVENAPFKNVKIVSLEHRGNGGRAYKIIAPIGGVNFYFDLREDILLEVMMSVGVQKNAVLNGSFCFAMIGSQMKVIRVDSDLYNSVIEAGKRKASKNLSMKDIKVGHVYSNRKGELMLYGGIVDSFKSENPDDIKSRMISFMKQQLWITASEWHVKSQPDIRKLFEEVFSDDRYWGYELKKSATVVEEVENLELTTEQICKMIRESAKRVLKKRIEENKQFNHSLEYFAKDYAEILCVHPTGSVINYGECTNVC